MTTKTKSTKSTKTAKAAKVGRTPVKFEPSVALKGALKTAMANDSVSLCEAIREVAKKFKKEPRGNIMTLLINDYKINKGTAARQVQMGRAS